MLADRRLLHVSTVNNDEGISENSRRVDIGNLEEARCAS
jgi:hypothetical protein